MYRPSQLPGRVSVISGQLQARGNSICLCLTGVLLCMTPQKATLDSMCTLLWLVRVSYQSLSPQFQFSLSATALGKYISMFCTVKCSTSCYVHSYWVTHTYITNNNIYKSKRVMKSYDTSAHSPPPPPPLRRLSTNGLSSLSELQTCLKRLLCKWKSRDPDILYKLYNVSH
jgi:hypothetical protein